MSVIWWNLAGTDKQCHSYGPGHWVHWIQHKLSVREPGPVIPVTASVDDDGYEYVFFAVKNAQLSPLAMTLC